MITQRTEFGRIVFANYSDTEICMCEYLADELMKDLDVEIADNLEWDSRGEFDPKINVPYDYQIEFDFRDPPEFSR